MDRPHTGTIASRGGKINRNKASSLHIDEIIRSKRKTVAIIIRRDGRLVVRAPYRLPERQILSFVESKREWIRAKQLEASQRKAQSAAPRFCSGEQFLYLGKSYPLEIVEQTRPALVLEAGRFLLSRKALPDARDVFTKWYKEKALAVINERAAFYANRYQLSYKKLRITSARSRWGSCSTAGTLSFTWRLVMAPVEVIDYVVIHELAHISEKNHSPRFWEKVRSMMSDYELHTRWLKENGHRLALE